MTAMTPLGPEQCDVWSEQTDEAYLQHERCWSAVPLMQGVEARLETHRNNLGCAETQEDASSTETYPIDGTPVDAAAACQQAAPACAAMTQADLL